MEPASLALGIISLAALFDSCIELADHIALTRNLGRDYETTYTKFLLLKARLYAWRPCLAVVIQRNQDKDERILVSRSLTAIKALFDDAQTIEHRYGLYREESSPDSNISASKSRVGVQTPSQSLAQVEAALNTAIRTRQSRTSWAKKFRWAIRDKRAFDVLINELAFHVNELENIAKRLNIPTLTTVRSSIRGVTSAAGIGLLEAAAAEPDLDQHFDTDISSTAGHVFVRNIVAEHAKAVLGDYGMTGDVSVGKSHFYGGNQIVGGARVVMGNVSGQSMKEFWAS